MNSSTKRKKTKERETIKTMTVIKHGYKKLNNIIYCNFYSYKLYPFHFI